MYFWNKIAITFKDGKTSICDKILFKQIGNWSIEYYSTGNILPTENATFESGSFCFKDIHDIRAIHCVPLLITVLCQNQPFEFLVNDLTYDPDLFRGFVEKTYLTTKDIHRQISSLTHNTIERTPENMRFIKGYRGVSDDFLDEEHFSETFSDIVYQTAIDNLLLGRSRYDIFVFSIEAIYTDSPEEERFSAICNGNEDHRASDYRTLTMIVSDYGKMVSLRTECRNSGEHYQIHDDERYTYSDSLSFNKRFSTMFECQSFIESIIATCQGINGISIRKDKGCDPYSFTYSIDCSSYIDWGKQLNIPFRHHPLEHGPF